MKFWYVSPFFSLPTIILCGCGTESQDDDPAASVTSLEASWSFDEGDCSTNGVEVVRLSVSREGEEGEQTAFDCADGTGQVGEVPVEGGPVSILAEGLDADGNVLATSDSQTEAMEEGQATKAFDLLLVSNTSTLVVAWNGCPVDNFFPYYVTLYPVSAETSDAELGEPLLEVQQSCLSQRTTIPNVPAGEYLVVVESRLESPDLRETKNVTIVPGEDARAYLPLP